MSVNEETTTGNEGPVPAFVYNEYDQIATRSIRTPIMVRRCNHADLIEDQLKADGHRTWGYVIYRTTYDNDEDWTEFLKRLRFRMEESFDFFNGRDILDLFTLTVIEDREHLDGVSAATVRERFEQWCATAHQLEQPEGAGPGLSPRYRFAVQVDAESLHSVVHDAPAPPANDATKKGWVKLIDLWWDPESDEDIEEVYDPIEGVTEKDVGWMKVPYKSVMDESHALARDRFYWVTTYQRPPFVVGYPYNE